MKILVTAASRHGSTSEIASIIAGVLQSSDIAADALSPQAVTSVVDYDAVILGSAVYAGHWLASAHAFIARHADDLATRPVFLFSSGPLGDPPRPPVEPVDAITADLATGAMDLQVFPGRLLERNLSLPERLAVAKMHAPDGDFRPWDDIVVWTKEIARYLRDEQVAPSEARRADAGG